ncbi:hypothetical protein C7S18_05300 [Ahniella affigens]|uniref:DUF308 domain-containing protein n=1 Tax=Ahniella affigens TaxID=2021234 RepID=A0A2P1PPA2_9GAMM|nr:hypothetical protein [Ahniella affigens]AVP96655.1 hypothetical protein C7S18_05300 [Ahniella affigens]
MNQQHHSLDQQRAEFCDRPFYAMPLAGTLAWGLIGLLSPLFGMFGKVYLVFILTGSIFGLGILIAKITGEDLLGKHRPKNVFDGLFMASVGSAWLVFAIAVPFFRQDPTSLPLSIGILAGLMWLPFSWIIQHWVGYFHGIVRTLLLVVAWYLWPEHRFTVLPAIIVCIYLVTLIALARRQRQMKRALA